MSQELDDLDAAILAEVHEERRRQDAKWGPPEPMPGFDLALMHRSPQRMAERYSIATAERAKWVCEEMKRRGECTIGDIFIEEVAEVIESYHRGHGHTELELIQVAAVCVKWIHTMRLERATEADTDPDIDRVLAEALELNGQGEPPATLDKGFGT